MKRTLSALAIAVVLVLLIRGCAFTSCIIPFSGEETKLCAGDRVLVNRWSYGYRLPLMELWDYQRWAEKKATPGDYVLFNNPAAARTQAISNRPLVVSRCMGAPGDTLSLNKAFICVAKPTPSTYPLVIPQKGKAIKVTPWNMTLLCNTIVQHEGGKATIREGKLYVNGRVATQVRFSKDYYWMANRNRGNMNDSRLFGLVPADHLVGRLSAVWFSHDPTQSFLKGYRWNRFFTSIE